MPVRIGKIRWGKTLKEYYADEIDLRINDVRNVDTSKLLDLMHTSLYYNATMNDVLSYKIENSLKSNNKEYNSMVAKKIIQRFESMNPSLETRRKQIYEEYSGKLDAVYEKYNIKKGEYSVILDINEIDTTFLTDEEVSKLTHFINEKYVIEINYKVNVHNLIIKELNKIYDNFEANLEDAIDDIKWEFKSDVKSRIKSMLLNPVILTSIIIYIILVVLLWDVFGAKSLLGGIFILILMPISDNIGTHLYGEKWKNMTQHEREMQIKKDTIINEMYNKRK